MTFKIITRDLFQKQSIGIWLFKQNERGVPIENAKPQNIQFEPIDGSGAFLLPEPWLEMHRREFKDVFQGLTDSLVEYGFKPKTEVTAAQLEILKDFLKREQQNHDRIFSLLEERFK
jgi:hypothetical protein